MVVLRQTTANLKMIKQWLRKAFPSVKSTHLTEAVAAGLGFRTHAALLKAMDRTRVGSEPITCFVPARAVERLKQLGYSPNDENLAMAPNLIDLPDPCWRLTIGDDRQQCNEWFYECQRIGLPYLVVKCAKRYATLEWDCITVDANSDQAVRGDRSREFVGELYALFQRHCIVETGGPMFEGSAFCGSIERLLPDTARALANEFFKRLYEATRPEDSVAAV